jgi:very-short-patch-repair endonuclease
LGLMSTAPEIVDITVPRNSHGRAARGTRLRRPDLADLDIVEHRSLRVTALPLTVVEAADRDPAIMDAALQRHVDLGQLQRAHLRNRGRYGTVRSQRLLDAAAGGARSEAERLAIRLLKDAEITGWQANFPVGGYVVDIAFPAQRVAIEIDGWAFHSDHHAFQKDRVRQNRLALQGLPRSASRFRRANRCPTPDTAPNLDSCSIC